METYSLLRHFADSWMLLALFIFFIGTWVWAFRPGSRRVHEDAPAEDDADGSQDNNTDPEGQK